MKKLMQLGKSLDKDQQKRIFGGYGEFGSCRADCTGCPAYDCSQGCTAMVDGDYVTCNGTTVHCHAYPTCWSTT